MNSISLSQSVDETFTPYDKAIFSSVRRFVKSRFLHRRCSCPLTKKSVASSKRKAYTLSTVLDSRLKETHLKVMVTQTDSKKGSKKKRRQTWLQEKPKKARLRSKINFMMLPRKKIQRSQRRSQPRKV